MFYLCFPVGNGESTYRQTDVDRQHRHQERFPPIGGEIQTSHQELQLQSVVSSQLSSRLHLLRQSSSASSAQVGWKCDGVKVLST